MQLGMIGLGRMGANMVRRLIRGGHACVAYDRNPDNVKLIARDGAAAAMSLDEFVAKLTPPKVIWLMLPAGQPTEETVAALSERVSAGDILIDGGNSYFKDDVRRSSSLKPKGISYLDVGTSGGVWGVERGYCLMVGGDKAAFQRIEPLIKTLAPGNAGVPPSPGRRKGSGSAEEGYLYCGPSGAGHFVKMIHNGIEYGLMQAYAEGFDVLKNANKEQLPKDHRYELDLPEIAELWRRGSVVGSWLLDLLAIALVEDPRLSGYKGFVEDSGEGRWTILAAVEEAVPADVLSASLYARFRSRQEHTFAEKVLSALRRQFGGHVERPSDG
jgi:6-phosphogluconate dehydrogenase